MALNKIPIFLVVMVLFSLSSFAIGTGDLVTYFTYDDADLSGSDPLDVHASYTQTNNGATTGATGKLDESFLCEATDYLTLANPINPSAYSINLWIYPDDTTNAHVLLGLHDGSNHDLIIDWSQTYSDDNMRVYIDGGWMDNASSQGWTKTAYQMMTFTYGGGEAKLYRNGVLTLNGGGKSDADATANPLKICTRGDFTTTQNFLGDIDELAIFDVALSQNEINELYNSGSGLAYPFGASPATSNSTTEQTSFFEQSGTVTVTSTSYQDIFSGNIEVLNETQAYSTYTVNVLPTNANTYCRAVIDGNAYGTETYRSGTSGEYGVMVFQSDNYSLTVGNHTSTLQCRKESSGTFEVSNSVGVVHLLKSSNNIEINHSFSELYGKSSGTTLNKSTYNYTVKSNVTGSKTLQLIAEGSLSYTYEYDVNPGDFQNAILNITFNGVECGDYTRAGTDGTTGSGGFVCLVPNATGVTSTNLTFNLKGDVGGGGNVTVNSSFVIKELVLNPSSSNHTRISFTDISSTSFIELDSITVNNSEFPSANLVAKAGISAQSDGGASEIDFRLRITSENGTTLHRDVDVADKKGLILSQWVFGGLNQGSYTVSLEGRCDNAACSLRGGDLIAYLTDDLPFAATSINVTVKDQWSNVSLSNFSAMTSDGTIFSTEGSTLQVFTANDPENLTIIKPNYFNKTYLNQNLSSVLAATIYQSEVSFTATQLITGNVLTGATFFIDGNQNTLFKLNASTHQVSATKEGYWNKTNTIVTTPLQNETVTFANMSNAIVNITLVEYVSGNTVSNFTVVTDYGVTLNTTNGYVELPILQNISARYINITNSLGGLFASVKDVEVTADRKIQNLTVYAYTFNSVLMTVYDADTQAILLNPNVTVSTISNATSFTNLTVNGTLLVDFLAPTDYEVRFNATGYNPRSLFITVLNDSTQNVSVYLTSNTSTELQTIQVLDTSNSEVEGAIVWLQKEIIGGDTQFITVQEAQTDFEGKTTVWVERDTTVFYRFAVIVNGTARPILPNRNTFTGKTSFIPAVTETIQIIIDLADDPNEVILDRLGISTSIYFNDTPTGAPNNNNTVFFDWIDARNTISGATLEIWGRFMLNSTSYELVDTQTVTGTSGSLNYSFTPINNTIYEIRGYINTDGRSELYEIAQKKFDIDVVVDKNTGLLYAVFLIVVVSLLSIPFQRRIGKAGVVASGVITFGSLYLLQRFSIVDISTTVITSLIAFVIIVFGVFKKNE